MIIPMQSLNADVDTWHNNSHATRFYSVGHSVEHGRYIGIIWERPFMLPSWRLCSFKASYDKNGNWSISDLYVWRYCATLREAQNVLKTRIS